MRLHIRLRHHHDIVQFFVSTTRQFSIFSVVLCNVVLKNDPSELLHVLVDLSASNQGLRASTWVAIA
jgi:hypothetical protein